LILKLKALQARGEQPRLGRVDGSVEVPSHRRGDNAEDIVESRRSLGSFTAWPVRLIDKPLIVTSVVIWSVQTGAGACDFRCASRATSCLNCLEVNNVWSRCSACSLNRPEAGMREISSATPSARTYKTFWRPSMPPKSPTEKSLNGSEGTVDGPMSEQPATANAAAVMSTATRRRSFPAVTTTP